jgi:hypothetical protein
VGQIGYEIVGLGNDTVVGDEFTETGNAHREQNAHDGDAHDQFDKSEAAYGFHGFRITQVASMWRIETSCAMAKPLPMSGHDEWMNDAGSKVAVLCLALMSEHSYLICFTFCLC